MTETTNLRDVDGVGFGSEDGVLILILFRKGVVVSEYDIPIESAKTLHRQLEEIVDRENL